MTIKKVVKYSIKKIEEKMKRRSDFHQIILMRDFDNLEIEKLMAKELRSQIQEELKMKQIRHLHNESN